MKNNKKLGIILWVIVPAIIPIIFMIFNTNENVRSFKFFILCYFVCFIITSFIMATKILHNEGSSWTDATIEYNKKQKLKQEKIAQENAKFVPKCPTCGSTNIRRINGTEKAVNAAAFGLLGNKRKCQFECQNPNCRYRW